MTNRATPFGAGWGTFATVADLPNVAASATQSDKLAVFDHAYVGATNVLHTCTTATLGAAVWAQSSVGGLGSIVLVTPTSRTNFATITLALAAAVAGDVVELGPGTYAESVTIPAGVQLVGHDGVDGAATVSGALATGTRITLSNGATLGEVRVTMPTDATPAIASPVTTSALVRRVEFTGAGAAGIGFRQTGAGATFLDRVTYLSGICDTFIDVTAGTVQANEVFVFSGTLTNIARVVGGTFNFVNFSIASIVVATDGIEVGAAGNVTGQTGRLLSGVVNALHVTSDTAMIVLAQFELEAGTADILGDPGVTAAGLRLSGGGLSVDRIDVEGAWRASAGWLISYFDEKEGDSAFRTEAELSVGAAERPAESSFGEGDSYTEGMVVITTDGTAGAVSDGGNLTDVSAAAASASASTFTFQGLTAGHAIMFGSRREDASSVLKHWGYKLLQTTAAVEVTPHSFVIENWDGAAWVSMGFFATHETLFHRYANEVFIRGNDSEHVRYGVDDDTTWATKPISGDTLFWSRIRIATTVTTAPVFQQSKLSTSRFEVNGDGTNTYHGLSRFRNTLVNAGNVFGETGGVVDFNVTLGSGGLPTGWAHPIKNSNLNQNADAIYFQFTLPRGIDTGFPLTFRVFYLPTTPGLADVDLILSALPVEVVGTLEADPAGGITPVPRTIANTATLTAAAATAVTQVIDSTVGTKIQSVDFGPYDIDTFYEGDIVFARLELDDDGVGNADIGITAVEVSGVKWTNGERL